MAPSESARDAPKSWLDLVKIHPAAAGRMMTDAELQELGEDWTKNGLRHPPVFWTPSLNRWAGRKLPKKLDIYLLDGRNRLEAIERYLSARPNPDVLMEDFIAAPGHVGPEQVKILLGYQDPYEYAISANLHRRHLTGEQKRELIDKLLRATPERSDSAIARQIKASDKTVTARLRTLEANSEIPNRPERTEASGRKARGRKPSRATAVEAEIVKVEEVVVDKVVVEAPPATTALGKDEVPAVTPDKKMRRPKRNGNALCETHDLMVVQTALALHELPKQTYDALARRKRSVKDASRRSPGGPMIGAWPTTQIRCPLSS